MEQFTEDKKTTEMISRAGDSSRLVIVSDEEMVGKGWSAEAGGDLVEDERQESISDAVLSTPYSVQMKSMAVNDCP